MTETTPINVDETYQIKEQQFTLLPTFEAFAKNQGFDKQAIDWAKVEISKRFTAFNQEGMTKKRFDAISGTIGGMVENELYNARSYLARSSKALEGTTLKYDLTNLQIEAPIREPSAPIQEAKNTPPIKIEINSSILRDRQKALKEAGQ